jgi:hypothetical protein
VASSSPHLLSLYREERYKMELIKVVEVVKRCSVELIKVVERREKDVG